MLPAMGAHVSNMNAAGKRLRLADDVIRFKLAVVEAVLGKPLEMIKAVLIMVATELCTGCVLGFWAEKLQHCLHNGASTSTSLRRC